MLKQIFADSGSLRIDLISGKDLRAADRNGKSDPYVGKPDVDEHITLLNFLRIRNERGEVLQIRDTKIDLEPRSRSGHDVFDRANDSNQFGMKISKSRSPQE